MKAIFVESANGYMAKGPDDDMLWTPSLDKKIYRLLSFALGGVYVVSDVTYKLLPQKMLNDPNRTFIVAEITGPNSLINLNKKYPQAILIGGPTFLKAADKLNLIDTYIITTVNEEIQSSEEFKNPFTLDSPICTINFGCMYINIYKNRRTHNENNL